jgi:ACS family tartrate transporter-like MFS transporter
MVMDAMRSAGQPKGKVMEHRPDVIAHVARRLLPILMVCYFAAFLDRVNIGFAALTMNADLKLSPEAFGFGAGIFFLGYILCEIPSNLALARFGARIWIARIMLTWGVLSALTAFVWDQNSFVIVRVLLGAAEAGFFPGMIFFLTLWFPRDHRARMIGVFNVAVPFSSVIGAPVSSLLLVHLDQVAGLHGWQWLFLLEGVPAVIMGIVVLLALPNGPEHARWLDASSKQWLADTLRREREEREADEHFSVWQALTDYRVLLMCLMAVGLVIGTTGTAIWMPQIVRAFGLSVVQTGFVAAIPALAMAIAMIVSGRHADRTRERVWHVAAPFLISAAGFAAAAFTDSPVISLIGLVVGAAGIGGATPNIWIFPTTLLTRTAAAGLALINSVGSLGGFFGPAIIGWVRQSTGSFSGALLFLAGVSAATAVIALILGRIMGHMLRQQPGTGAGLAANR